MKFIQTLIQKFIKEKTKPLGRWQIDYCNKKINKKIDFSNEDHCGPCGQYLIKSEQHIIENNLKKIDNFNNIKKIEMNKLKKIKSIIIRNVDRKR